MKKLVMTAVALLMVATCGIESAQAALFHHKHHWHGFHHHRARAN
ncbi:hypothetical protein [Burkholderia sp. BCC1988]|nr:hypothetical protein [Burkholderia sp. BCC1988]